MERHKRNWPIQQSFEAGEGTGIKTQSQGMSTRESYNIKERI